MANEVKAFYLQNQSLFITVQTMDLLWCRSSDNAFVTKPDNSLEPFFRSMTETNPGEYQVDFPPVPAGKYLVKLWLESTNPRVDSEPIISVDIMNWSGTAELEYAVVGSGPYFLTITAKDQDGNVVDDVLIRITKSLESLESRTGESGQAMLAVTAGTWSISAARVGYTYTGGSVIVSGDMTQEIALVSTVIQPAGDLLKCNCWQTIRTPVGELDPNTTFEFNMLRDPADSTDNYSFKNFKVTADANAMLQIELPRLAQFEYRWGRGKWKRFTVPDAPTFKLPQINDGL